MIDSAQIEILEYDSDYEVFLRVRGLKNKADIDCLIKLLAEAVAQTIVGKNKEEGK